MAYKQNSSPFKRNFGSDKKRQKSYAKVGVPKSVYNELAPSASDTIITRSSMDQGLAKKKVTSDMHNKFGKASASGEATTYSKKKGYSHYLKFKK